MRTTRHWLRRNRGAAVSLAVIAALVTIALLPGTLIVVRGQSTLPNPPPQPTASLQTPLGTVTATGINLDPGVTLSLSLVTAGGFVYEQAANSVTILVAASNGAGSAGRQVQGCLNGGNCQVVTLNPNGAASVTFGGAPLIILGNPVAAVAPPQPSSSVITALGTVTITGLNLDAGVSLAASLVGAGRLKYEQASVSVTILVAASNGNASAGRQVQACLNGSSCQTLTLNGNGSTMVTFSGSAAPASVAGGNAAAAAGGTGVQPASATQLPAAATRSAAVSSPPAPRPATASAASIASPSSTVTITAPFPGIVAAVSPGPTSVVPSRAPSTGLGGAQQPAGAAAAVRPGASAPVPANVALPNTGAGGRGATRNSAVWSLFGTAMLLGLAGSLVLRRPRS